MKLKGLSLALVIVHVLLASPAFSQSTTSIVTRVDKPELYMVHASRQMNLDLVFYLRSGTRGRSEDVEALKDWLMQQGFRVTGGATDGFVDASGSVDAAESAFQVQIMMTSDGKGYGPLQDAKIPTEFRSVVQSISGLSTVTVAPYRSFKRVPPKPNTIPSTSPLTGLISPPPFKSGGLNAFGPYDLRTFYDARL